MNLVPNHSNLDFEVSSYHNITLFISKYHFGTLGEDPKGWIVQDRNNQKLYLYSSFFKIL